MNPLGTRQRRAGTGGGFASEARIDTAEFVTERAMLGLDRLNRVEAVMARENPIKAAQFSGLVDDYLMIARHEIRRLPSEF